MFQSAQTPQWPAHGLGTVLWGESANYATSGTTVFTFELPRWCAFVAVVAQETAGGTGAAPAVIALKFKGTGVDASDFTRADAAIDIGQDLRYVVPVLGADIVTLQVTGIGATSAIVNWVLYALPAIPELVEYHRGFMVGTFNGALPASGTLAWKPLNYNVGGLWQLSGQVSGAAAAHSVTVAQTVPTHGAATIHQQAIATTTNNFLVQLALARGPATITIGNATAGALTVNYLILVKL